VLKRLLTRFVHIEPGIQLGVTAVVAFVVAIARDQQGPGGLRPGLRPPQNVGAVTADPRVDDLESERTERYRGFESLRFRPSTSTNTDIVIISRLSVDGGGCISGGIRATR
jgi:hypothetical protein